LLRYDDKNNEPLREMEAGLIQELPPTPIH